MNIPLEIIEELRAVGFQKPIINPYCLYEVGVIPMHIKKIGSDTSKVFISRMALKHIIDNRGEKAAEVIKIMPHVLMFPAKIADNSVKKKGSFLFAGTFGRHYGVVLEVTKTTGLSNQVVSAFIINPKTYEKIHDISGGTAPPQ